MDLGPQLNCENIIHFKELKTVLDKLTFHLANDRKMCILHSEKSVDVGISFKYWNIKLRPSIRNHLKPRVSFDFEYSESENKKIRENETIADIQGGGNETKHAVVNGEYVSSDLDRNVFTKEKVLDILEVITSVDAEINEKLKCLNYLIEMCSRNDIPMSSVLTNSLLKYTESLLFRYYCVISNKKDKILEHSDELNLLIPLLKLLVFSQTMTVEKIRSAYIHRSYVMLELMHTLTQCFENAAEMGRNICKYSSGNIIISAAIQMEPQETKIMFGKCHSLQIRSQKFQIHGYKVIFLNTLSDSSSTISVQEDLRRVKTEVQLSSKYGSLSDFDFERVKWLSLTVARLLPLKYILVYTELNWKDTLRNLSGCIHRFLADTDEFESLQQKVFGEGDIIGFKACDATFEGCPLLSVQCLRGYVLAVTGIWMMVWAMDIGLLCCTSKPYVRHLPDREGFSDPALIKFCELQGVECNFDENFFVRASNLLLILLRNNSQTGKHILLSDKGQSVLCLLEHPTFEVRINVLDILSCLGENCQDVRAFLEEKFVDILLAKRLERFAQAFASQSYEDRRWLNVETLVMTKILCVLVGKKKDIKDWPGCKQAVRAFRILHDVPNISWKKFIEKMLFQLGFFRKGNSVSYPRQRQKENVRNSPNHPKLQNNNRLCEYHFQKIDFDEIVLNETVTSVESEAGGEKTSVKSNTDYYILGSKVDIVPDQTHELMEQITLDGLKEVQLAEVLCGLLNNNTDSMMYFGLTKESIVKGIVLHREDKDVFRNGIDRVMSKCLLPEVRADSYDVLFTPVLKAGDKPKDLSKIHLYVIEVRVHPLMHMAYVVYQGRRCYVRQDNHTVEWTVMQKKNYMMEQEEKLLEESIIKLSEDTKNNIHLIANILQKYITNK